MKGMSATNLIVSLAVGLIVIVGLGYLVWTWLGRGGGQINEAYCNGQLLAYCTRWSAVGYPTTGVSDELWYATTNGGKCKAIDGFAGLGTATSLEARCKSLLGQS